MWGLDMVCDIGEASTVAAEENQKVVEAKEADLPVIPEIDDLNLDGTNKLVGLNVVSDSPEDVLDMAPHSIQTNETTYKVEDKEFHHNNE
jgi:hypothetical protein